MKLNKEPNTVYPGTHDGIFHPDECVGGAIEMLKNRNKGLRTVFCRTRDPELLEQCDVLLDIGRKNDENNSDHHQLQGLEAFRNDSGIPFATAGIHWDKHGMELCSGSSWVFSQIKLRFILPIDAWDNGFFLGSKVVSKGKHRFRLPSIFDMIQSWRLAAENDEEMDRHFEKVVDFLADTLENEIKRLIKYEIKLKERALRIAEIRKEKINNELRFIVVVEDATKIAATIAANPDIWCVIYPRNKKRSSWFVRIIENEKKHGVRQFPESWPRIKQEQLAKLTGCADVLSCQNNRQVATATTVEGAKKLATKALLSTASRLDLAA